MLNGEQGIRKNVIFAKLTVNKMLMKNLNVFTIFLLAFTMSILTACSEDEDFNIPIPQQMTAEEVMAALDGKGWQHVESHEVKSNGTIEREDYWTGMIGSGPSQYAFSSDSVTTYSYVDAYPISGYRTKKYTYNEATNQLMAGGNEMFRIISISENELKLIKYQAIDGKGKKIYIYSIYRAMSSTELAECMQNHPYDFDSFNEKYPALPEQMRITSEYFNRYAVGNGWKCTEAHKLETAGRYDITNIYRDNEPGMPDNCFIAGDTITWLPRCIGMAVKAAESAKYSYRPNGFYLSTDAGTGFKIIALNDSEMRIVRIQSEGNGGNVTELYCIYRKMTPEELEQYMSET